MKTAIVKSKNDITGLVETEGEAILLNCLDKQETRGFYEIKFINDAKGTTHCRWIDNESVRGEKINECLCKNGSRK